MVTQSTHLWKGCYTPAGIEPTPGLQVHATPCHSMPATSLYLRAQVTQKHIHRKKIESYTSH